MLHTCIWQIHNTKIKWNKMTLYGYGWLDFTKLQFMKSIGLPEKEILLINPFVPNVPFLYLLKKLENRKFSDFSWGWERVH